MIVLSVVVCNNGLGHAKRVANLVGGLLDAVDLYLKIYADRKRLDYIKRIVSASSDYIRKIEWNEVDADVHEYEQAINDRYRDSWYIKSNAVWSDNLLFPRYYHCNVIITGSFVWSEVSKDKKFIQREKALLKHNLRMVGIEYFATDEARKLDFIGVGVYDYLRGEIENSIKAINKKNILISCGTSKNGVELFKRNLSSIRYSIIRSSCDIKIFIDPQFYDYFRDIRCCFPADYSAEMYQETDLAVIRPGIGTICDAICSKIKIYAVVESDNEEMLNNGKIIEALGIGKIFDSYSDSIDQAIKHIGKCQNNYEYGSIDIATDGLESTVRVLNNFLLECKDKGV